MEFNPNNPVIQRCLQGMALEEKGQPEAAAAVFIQAWNEAANDFEKFTAAHYVARHQKTGADELTWLQTALQLALQLNTVAVNSALPGMYAKIAACYARLNDPDNAQKHNAFSVSSAGNISDPGPFYHGTKADLQVGDFLTPGFGSNYQPDLKMNHIYFTALVNGAGLAAALAQGKGPERVYIVEPTGPFENDPNVTNKKFPGNPTRSYRTTAPLKITGESTEWIKQTPEQIQMWSEKLAKNQGAIIN